MNILAIDQSLVESGISVRGEETNGIETSTLKSGKLIGLARLQYIRNEVAALLERYEIQVVVMEGYSFGSQGMSVFNLGELGGILKLMFKDRGIDLHTIPPSTLKKHIVGKGNAKKEEMLLKIYKKWGVEFSNNNAADSYGLMKYYEDVIEGNHEYDGQGE